VVDAFPEQTEASASVDPSDSVRADMVPELKETTDVAVVPAPEGEVKGTEEPDLLTRRFSNRRICG
jgi:hypothetical protein